MIPKRVFQDNGVVAGKSPWWTQASAAGLLILAALLNVAVVEAAQRYQQTNLISDLQDVAANTDANLVNPWGLARSSTSPWWVADNGTGVSTLYNISTGGIVPLVVTLPPPSGGSEPAKPTGIVFNGTTDFVLRNGKPAFFIFVTEDGTISGWNLDSSTNAVLTKDNSPNAVYKGATLAWTGTANLLYVANFLAGTVDVFDTHFSPVSLGWGAFTDPKIPAGFAPFNVQNIGGKIFVTYAKQDADKHDEIAGRGLGFVDVFDASGVLLMRLKSGRWMNAPWGVALAPSDFGKFSNHILVGNFGSGHITAFDPKSGKFRGFLRGAHGMKITIEGLWGLGFGNGAGAGPTNTLFFAAGIEDEMHGLFGTITPMPKDNDADDKDEDE